MRRPSVLLAAAAFVLSFFVFAFVLLDFAAIPDTDSYFHLAVGRLYAEDGFVDALPWARFSALGKTFGDKELLFHVALMPFGSMDDAPTGGRIAVALINALVVATITFTAVELIGTAGVAVAPLLYLTAPYLWLRLFRLRPESFSLLLLLAITFAAMRRRHRLVAVLSALLALSHTAFHVVLGIAALWLLVVRWRERRWEWPLAIAPAAGIAIGLLLHPQFPANVRIWWLQNVRLFQLTGSLDIGAELLPPSLPLFFAHNSGWWLLAIVTLLFVRPPRDARALLFFAPPALIFALLQLRMERMSTYFFPFATFALLALASHLRPFGAIDKRPLLRNAAFAIVAAIAVAISWPSARAGLASIANRPHPAIERDWSEMAKHLPANAKVAARWGATDAYVFWAPRARYLNVLEPTFMAVPHPREYAMQRALFDGVEPDVVAAMKQLDSDYLAVGLWETPPVLAARLAADPRLERLYAGKNLLVRVVASDAFVFGPRFVRGDDSRCSTVSRRIVVSTGTRIEYELAGYGPARLFVDDVQRLTSPPVLAVLGRGARAMIELSAGEHSLRVESCPHPEEQRNGFYFVERFRTPL